VTEGGERGDLRTNSEQREVCVCVCVHTLCPPRRCALGRWQSSPWVASDSEQLRLI
jgi:hypothetical protein